MEKWIKLSRRSSSGLPTLKGEKSISCTLETDGETRKHQADWMSRTGNIDARIISFIQNHNFDHDRYTYVIVAPLGADESWEETVNGDAFTRDTLAADNDKYGHRTFETNARAYMHHQNTDPAKSFGDFPNMFYNKDMDRCEGVWRLIHADAPNVIGAEASIAKYRAGKDMPISMGCKVPFDICALCGNEAKTPADYCGHVRSPGFGSIMPDGRKMRVFNPWALFFDLSPVDVNAAPEATPLGWIFPELIAYLKAMSKSSAPQGWVKSSSGLLSPSASSHRIVVPSSYLAAYHEGVDSRSRSLSKTSSLEPVKLSDMIKHIPLMASDILIPLDKSETEITPDDLDDVAKQSASQVSTLSNLGSLGIVLRPAEFRHLLCSKMDIEDHQWPSMAEEDIREGFNKGSRNLLNPESIRGHILSKIKDLAPTRSILFPHMARRIAHVRHGSCAEPARSHPPAIKVKLDIEVPKELSVLYGQYIKELSLKMAELVRTLLSRFPKLGHDLGVKGTGELSSVIATLGGTSSSVKTSQLAAQALLPSAYLLHKAHNLGDHQALLESVDALNQADTARVFGGVYGSGV